MKAKTMKEAKAIIDSSSAGSEKEGKEIAKGGSSSKKAEADDSDESDEDDET